MMRVIFLSLLICFASVSVVFGQTVDNAAQRPLDIVFVNPSSESDDFWRAFEKFMVAAAEDVNINLEVLHSGRDRERMLQNVRTVVRRSTKPDAIVFINLKGNGAEALAMTDEAQILTFMVNAGSDYAEVGKPREKYSYWIGELLPDDEKAGYDMAHLLVNTAKAVGLTDANGVVHVLALEGVRFDAASIARVAGLQRALKDLDNVKLEQIVAANWLQDVAKDKFYWLYGRYPETHVVWCASDGMALGVAEQAEELGVLHSGSVANRQLDLLVGGVDWIIPAQEAVQRKDLLLTMGGHFMDGARTIILLRDYFDGIDFADDTTTLSSEHTSLSSVNIDAYNVHLGNEDTWGEIDFQQFSKSYNPNAGNAARYPFSLDMILEQFVEDDVTATQDVSTQDATQESNE